MDTTSRQLGEFFRQQFDQIGVKITVIPNSFPNWLEKQKVGNLQFGHGGWELDYPDAQSAYTALYGKNQAPGPNESNFNNPEFDALYEKVDGMSPSPERDALIAKMEAIVQESAWAMAVT